jgi:hypothetical protein
MCQQFDREAYNALMDYETQIDPIAKMATIKFLSTLMSIIQPIIRRHSNNQTIGLPVGSEGCVATIPGDVSIRKDNI